MLGRRSENDAVVTEYDPPYRAKIAGTSPNAPFIGTQVFGREGEATHVEITTEFVFRGASRIAGPVVTWWYGRAWTRGLETLRRLMESGQLGRQPDREALRKSRQYAVHRPRQDPGG